MGTNKMSIGHGFNIAGWACLVIFFAIVEFVGKPASLLFVLMMLLCGLALKFYNEAALEKAADKTE